MSNRQEVAYFGSIPKGVRLSQFKIETFKPCNGTVLAEFLKPEEKTEGGLEIPERFRQQQDIGQVMAVPNDPECPVKVGDWILIRHMGGDMVTLCDDKDLRLLTYSGDCGSDILGTLQKEKSSPKDLTKSKK